MLRIIAGIAFTFILATTTARAETYRLSYEAAVLGVVVLGAANYEVSATPTRYAVRASLRTSGLARLFDQTEITATSTGSVSGAAISWARYDISHAYASKFRRTQMNRSTAGVSAQITPTYGDMGRPPTSAEQRRGSYDPLTGVFALGRQIGAARACRGAVLIFDGRQHYRLSVAAKGQGQFSGGGYQGPALNCQFRYEPIAGFSDSMDRTRIPVGDAWFALPAEGGFAPPLRLTIPTPLGDAQLDLRSYQRLN